MNEYSTLKAAWHGDRIQAMRMGQQAVPVNVQLIISDFCNHDCHFCAYRASNGLSSEQFGGFDKKGNPSHNPHRMIPTEKVREILRDAKALGVKSITWTGGGEPTAHPDHMRLFGEALDLGMECSLNTNGSVFRRGWSDVLPKFTYIRFSIDGGTPEDYAKTRSVPIHTYRKVMENLEDLCAEVDRVGSDCVVGTGYVVTPDNYAYLVRGIENIRAAGAKYVRVASMQSTLGAAVYGGAIEEARAAVAAARSLSTDEFQVVDLFDSALGRRMDDSFCGFQQIVLYIGGNMKVYRCCYVAYTQAGEVGDLSKQSLAQWFYSDPKHAAYRDFDARSCGVCPLADKNQVIGYMVGKPTHVNFI